VLVIGVGSIGERHVRCFQQTGRAAISICEINDRLRDSVAQRYGIKQAFSSLDAALAGPPAAAVICTPAHLHVELAARLAEHGVHLLIEKPLSTTLEGVSSLSATVARQRVVAAVAYVYRAHPVLAEMRGAIHSGRFGRPLEIVAVSGQHFPFYRPAYREIYYTDRQTGGGAVQDALTHLVNAVEWLIGPMSEVAADAMHAALPDVEVEDTVHVIARHGQIPASYSLNQHQFPNESSITVMCERATVRFEVHEHRWRFSSGPGEPWHDEAHAPLERDTSFVNQAHAFLDALEGTQAPLCSLDEGIQTLRANLAILKAADTRTWQRVAL
jgi:predicted dehydrogenase